MNSKTNPWVLLTCVAVMLVSGVVAASAGVSDAWVSAKVKMLLINSPEVSGLPIDVDTDQGRVTLHGKVPSTAEKKEAERIARAGTGVMSVRNLLQIVPDSRRKSVSVTDDKLQDAVNAAIKAEPALANSEIHAKSVNKGVVLLEGNAASLSDHLLALEVTSTVPGVRQVASEIKSPDEFADREIWADETPSAPAKGNAVTDGWITAQTKYRFMTDADIPAGDINVDTRRGVVTLFGTVPSKTVSDKALDVAKAVPGVREVNRELRVVAPSQKKQATAHDDQLESSIRGRIGNAKMEGADVHVEVKAATARLTGTVQRASDRYAVVSIAHATQGITRVENDVRVEIPQASR